MIKQFQDNVEEKRRIAAAAVVGSSLFANIKNASTKQMLEAMVLGNEVEWKRWSFFSVEFSYAETYADLDITLDRVGEPKKCEAGHLWQEYELKTRVNHPCHGSTEPGLLITRCDFYQRVAMLAAAINAELSRTSIVGLVMTHTELEYQRISNERARIQELVRDVTDLNTHGLRLRVGAKVPTFIDVTVPTGSYDVTIGKKLYRVISDDNHRMSITRVT